MALAQNFWLRYICCLSCKHVPAVFEVFTASLLAPFWPAKGGSDQVCANAIGRFIGSFRHIWLLKGTESGRNVFLFPNQLVSDFAGFCMQKLCLSYMENCEHLSVKLPCPTSPCRISQSRNRRINVANSTAKLMESCYSVVYKEVSRKNFVLLHKNHGY